MKWALILFTALLFTGCCTVQTPQAKQETTTPCVNAPCICEKKECTPCVTCPTQRGNSEEKTKRSLFTTATLVNVYDGDTFKVNLQCTEAVFCNNVPVRVKGIDTPEMKTKNVCEKRAAQQAKAFTTSFLQGHKLDLRNCTRDKYFRLLCDVYSDGQNLASELIKQNLAYLYDGGTKRKINWCK